MTISVEMYISSHEECNFISFIETMGTLRHCFMKQGTLIIPHNGNKLCLIIMFNLT